MRWQWDHSRRTLDPVKRVIVPNSFPLKPEHLPVLNVEIYEKVGSKIFLRCIHFWRIFIFGNKPCPENRNRGRVICPTPESERCFLLLSDSAVARYDCSFNQTFWMLAFVISLSLSRRFITSLVRLLWPSIIALIVYKPWMENGRN